jgi:hypothetical protein
MISFADGHFRLTSKHIRTVTAAAAAAAEVSTHHHISSEAEAADDMMVAIARLVASRQAG